MGRQLDHSVRLAGDDVGVVGHPDVERLAAAAQGQQQLVGLGAGRRGDGHRPLEAGHGVAEGGGEVGAFGDAAGDEGGDDLGVGGDLGGDLQAVERLEVGEVVDVAVERGHDERDVAVTLLGAVDRVGVGLADHADRGPPGVPEDDGHRVVGGHGQAQQVVGPEGVAQRTGVVAQLADLGGRLVDEGQAAVDHPHGARAEQGVGRPAAQKAGDGEAVDVEPVVADEDVQAGGVAAPHLEPVDGGQRLLDRRVGLGRSPARLTPGQVGHGAGGTDAVLLDGPRRVLEADHRGVHGLERGGVPRPGPVPVETDPRRRASGRGPAGAVEADVEAGLDGGDAGDEGRAHALDLGQEPPVVDECPHALGASEQGVGPFDVLGRSLARLGQGQAAGQRRHRLVQGLGDLRGRCCLARAGATDDRDDATHGRRVYGGPWARTSAAGRPGHATERTVRPRPWIRSGRRPRPGVARGRRRPGRLSPPRSGPRRPPPARPPPPRPRPRSAPRP